MTLTPDRQKIQPVLHFSSVLISFLALYCFISIFYVFPSGYPQPSDLILATGTGLCFVYYAMRTPLSFNIAGYCLIGFVIYTLFVNLFHYLHLKDIFLLFSSAFYLYNGGVFAFITILFTLNPDQTRKWLRIGLIGAVLIETVFLINIGAVDIREIGTFNNPNQLGYWALLMTGCLFLLKDKDQYFSWLDYLILLILTLAALMSLSRGVIAGFPILIALYVFSSQTKRIIRYLALGFGIILTLSTVGTFLFQPQKAQEIAYIGPVLERFLKTGELSHDNIEGRGYTRLTDYPHYLILGAGEGGYERFDPVQKLEFHSGFGNILFSYGIIGFGLFLGFFIFILKNAPPRVWITLAPIIFYSLTHQSFRFTLFWVFLAICYQVKKEYVLHKQHVQSI